MKTQTITIVSKEDSVLEYIGGITFIYKNGTLSITDRNNFKRIVDAKPGDRFSVSVDCDFSGKIFIKDFLRKAPINISSVMIDDTTFNQKRNSRR